FPGLANATTLTFQSMEESHDLQELDVLFLAQENGKAMSMARHLAERGARIVDLSADFRFRDAAEYNAWYTPAHVDPEAASTAVYGLPELFRKQISAAAIVGNPGCYATASILALAPLLSADLVGLQSVVIDAKSGVSGAGRSRYSQEYHFPEANESVAAYKVGGTHRHIPEIEQALREVCGEPLRISFTPHLIPMTRGILATCYARLKRESTTSELLERYRDFYRNERFVDILSEGTPSTKQTLGGNTCRIGLAMDSRTGRVTVISALDNLVKGMAGQAIQNMNLMLGLPETAGLTAPALWP
ncbi:MAG TPA: N-acetyl-gamma-glutamyl-phosphate reductase, partial [Chthonomonadales bacterium]|nr:N-acetyl-gamma-glutamyl-phosphate reductase [Chthonomonadales bacterium]